jgi:hypothetical protein
MQRHSLSLRASSCSESNLKIRQVAGNLVPPSLADNLDACLARLSTSEGLLRCDEPNADLYSFRASLQLRDAADLPVSLVNTAWRGSILRNTKWAIGLVVYTGASAAQCDCLSVSCLSVCYPAFCLSVTQFVNGIF